MLSEQRTARNERLSRMRGPTPLALVVLAAFLTVSCAPSPGTPAEGNRALTPTDDPSVAEPASVAPLADVFLPTYSPMDTLPEALIGGRLILDDGCLWLEHQEGRALPLWPSGSSLEQAGDTLIVVQHGGRARAEVGTDVLGGGGGYGPEHYDFVVELIGEEIPPACRGEDHYALVYDVRAASSEWGPLALVDGTGDMARNEGVVVITDACVFLERDGERALLVWPSDRTRWNSGDGTIAFTPLAGVEVSVESGPRVVLAGGGADVRADGDAWADPIHWARPPAPECLTDGAWFVTDVE